MFCLCYLAPDHPTKLFGQAQGRSIGVINTSDSSRIAREVSVPLFDNGTLRYTMMEIIVGDRIGGGWQLKDEPIQPFPGPMLEPLGGDSSSGWGGGTGRPRGGKAIHDDEQLPLPWADDGDNGDWSVRICHWRCNHPRPEGWIIFHFIFIFRSAAQIERKSRMGGLFISTIAASDANINEDLGGGGILQQFASGIDSSQRNFFHKWGGEASSSSSSVTNRIVVW
jgi:hypothetical protein